jgi:HK97 family phage major capsid protein
MFKNPQDALQRRGEIIHEMKAMLDAAAAEGRDLNAEESAKFDAMNADADSLKQMADRMERVNGALSALDDVRNAAPRPSVTHSDGDKPARAFASSAYRNAFDEYARKGRNGLSYDVLNALQVGTDSEGGFITPEEFETTLVEYLQDINQMRQFVTVVNTASDRNIPVETSLGTATWTAEEAAYTESDAAFGQVVLGAHKIGTIIKVSEELLQDAFFDVQAYLARNFGKRFGLAEEAAFVNGNGSGKPTGIVGGSGAGVTATGVAAITSDELIDLFHAVPRQYRNGSSVAWLMNDATAKLIRKLKDGDSQYLWQPGLQAGQPDLILGRPVVVSQAMPTPAAGAKTIVFGDMSGYYVADRAGMTMQRLNELYAANGQVGFRAYKRMDGKTVDATGLKHLVQAAS